MNLLVTDFMGHYVNCSECSGRIRLTLLIRDTKFKTKISTNTGDSGQTFRRENIFKISNFIR